MGRRAPRSHVVRAGELCASMKHLASGFTMEIRLPNVLNGALHIAARRHRQVTGIWRAEGYRGIAERVRRLAAEQLKPRAIRWEVLPEDVMSADLTRRIVPPARPRCAGSPISLNWVTTPAASGSGGHTTTFRMIRYLESRGFRNSVYFYDAFNSDHRHYVQIARDAYGVECPIFDTREGIGDADGIIATSWASAYAVYNERCAGKRFYFVQDYEPHFYAAGSFSLLAENTYRMGFHGITAGRWLAGKLSREFGMQTDYFPFGCDTSQYRRDPGSKRSGVAFYARSETPRRGFELGILALRIFAERNPDIQVHLFGERTGDLPLNIIDHGLVSPARLNAIYNQCYAGLCLSLTNVSLVPHEMLASGCIPVVNDAEHNRMVLDNPNVRYAPAEPHALARALEEVARAPDLQAASLRAAESVKSTSWDEAGAFVAAALRRALEPVALEVSEVSG